MCTVVVNVPRMNKLKSDSLERQGQTETGDREYCFTPGQTETGDREYCFTSGQTETGTGNTASLQVKQRLGQGILLHSRSNRDKG